MFYAILSDKPIGTDSITDYFWQMSLLAPLVNICRRITSPQGIRFAFLLWGAIYFGTVVCYIILQFMAARGLTAPDGLPIGRDFAAFWSVGRLLLADGASALYDVTRFHQTLWEFFQEGFGRWPYPPLYSLVLWPLGYMAYLPALLVWTLAGLLSLLAAVGARRPDPIRVFALLLLAPGVMTTILNGQNALFFAALVIAGMRLTSAYKVTAGLCFAVAAMVIKPQLGLLLPVYLLATRQWKVIFAAAGWGVLLIIISLAAFGVEPWRLFFTTALTGHASHMLGTHSRIGMPTVYMFLLLWGNHWLAAVGQAVVGAIVCIASWRFFAKRHDRELQLAMLACATLLVTPYAFCYDLPLLSLAVLPLLPRAGRDPLALTALALVWMLPTLQLAFHIGALVIGMFFLCLLRLGAEERGKKYI